VRRRLEPELLGAGHHAGLGRIDPAVHELRQLRRLRRSTARGRR